MSGDRSGFNRFSTLPTIDGGACVIDSDGRQVDWRPNPRSASGRAFVLNEAAAVGPKQLIGRLIAL